jgi:hypothetical protein
MRLPQLAHTETEVCFRIIPGLMVTRHRLPLLYKKTNASIALAACFDFADECMVPNFGSNGRTASQKCDAAQVDGDITRGAPPFESRAGPIRAARKNRELG